MGKPVVLNFWAGLLPYSRVEMLDLERFNQEFGASVTVIGIDVGQFTGLGYQGDAENLLAELGVTYPAGLTTDPEIMKDYNIIAMPTTVFVDAQGAIFEHWSGVINYETLVRITNEMLAQE